MGVGVSEVRRSVRQVGAQEGSTVTVDPIRMGSDQKIRFRTSPYLFGGWVGGTVIISKCFTKHCS